MSRPNHQIIHQDDSNVACACGDHRTNYGLTRTLVSLWAGHVREAVAAERAAERVPSAQQIAGLDPDATPPCPHSVLTFAGDCADCGAEVKDAAIERLDDLP